METDAPGIAKGLASTAAASRQQLRLAVQACERRLTRKPLVAHHGIQRSGTNYLRELLRQSGSFVVNGVDHARNDPRHKHFRWQADKSSIVMDSKFLNATSAGTISDVNAKAHYPEAVRHVVIFKHPARWLDSIVRWGVACRWTPTSAGFWTDRELQARWLQEWSHYYSQWQTFAEDAPDQVVLLAYEDLVLRPTDLVDNIFDRFGWGPAAPLKDRGRIEQVACSLPRSELVEAFPAASLEAEEAIRRSKIWDHRTYALQTS